MDTDGILPDNNKIKAITDFQSPKNEKQLKQFIGACNYYNQFIDKYPDYIKEITHLSSKRKKCIWTEKEEQTFKVLKDKFLETNFTHHLDYSKRFYLQTDASNIAR